MSLGDASTYNLKNYDTLGTWVVPVVGEMADVVVVKVTAIFGRAAGSRATRNLRATDTHHTTNDPRSV